MSPDFAKILIDIIYKHKPKNILELGSGVSTIISSYCLKSIGDGCLISIDHDRDYGTKTEINLKLHSLDNIARIINAPLTLINIADQQYKWYDTSKIEEEKLQSIDLLVIDGPSCDRYPALPKLKNILSNNVIILVDDVNRNQEQQMVKMWLDEFKDMEMVLIESEKGTAILRKKLQ
ncbi:MAG: class I SAM-dependent methyltransferase [Sphaerospermopsis sp. SIO1G2]|nr:class I SAM-dependent methyltransferase [Sphaerospermopsis sp. SIO1G2]